MRNSIELLGHLLMAMKYLNPIKIKPDQTPSLCVCVGAMCLCVCVTPLLVILLFYGTVSVANGMPWIVCVLLYFHVDRPGGTLRALYYWRW